MLDGYFLQMEDDVLSVMASVTIKDCEEEMVMNEVAYGGGAFMIDYR